jgi:hypothetical protein
MLNRPKVGTLAHVVSVVKARDIVGSQSTTTGAQAARTGHDVALLLSPLDSHVFDQGKDLGGMPLTVTVPEGRVLELEARRPWFFPRHFKLDGKKSRVIVRLTPIPGVTPGAPVPEMPAGETETGEPATPAKPGPATAKTGAAPAKTGATQAEAAKASDTSSESKPSGPQPGAPALGPSGAEKKPAAESEKRTDKAPAPASS